MSTGADTPAAVPLQAQALTRELDWLEAVVQLRLEQHFQQRQEGFEAAPLPPILPADSELARTIEQCALNAQERLVLALALFPHLRPAALDLCFVRNQNLD